MYLGGGRGSCRRTMECRFLQHRRRRRRRPVFAMVCHVCRALPSSKRDPKARGSRRPFFSRRTNEKAASKKKQNHAVYVTTPPWLPLTSSRNGPKFLSWMLCNAREVCRSFRPPSCQCRCRQERQSANVSNNKWQRKDSTTQTHTHTQGPASSSQASKDRSGWKSVPRGRGGYLPVLQRGLRSLLS